MVRELPGEYVVTTLITAINRQGNVFLWPIKLPTPDGRTLEWHRSIAEAAEIAQKRWVRVKADMNLGAYLIYEASGTIPDPEWPDVTFQDLLKVAFGGGRLVDRVDHPVIGQLRGQS
jgi:hypothetical protein